MTRDLGARLAASLACLVLSSAPPLLAQDLQWPQVAARTQVTSNAADYVPDLSTLQFPTSELRDVVERYSADRAALLRRWAVEASPERRAQLRAFHEAWRDRLQRFDVKGSGLQGHVDDVLLANRVDYEIKLLERQERLLTEMEPLIPFGPTMTGLVDARRRMESVDPAKTAATLSQLVSDIEAVRKRIEGGLTSGDAKKPTNAKEDKSQGGRTPLTPNRIVALRAAEAVSGLTRSFDAWFKYYSGYDPLFSWWATAPYKEAEKALKGYEKLLRQKIVGYKEGEDEPIVGDPIGRDAILEDLAFEMIAYTPEDLIEIAEREFAWCEAEMKKASREMGFGDDWKRALEKVKSLHVPPGKQPDLVRDLANEAVAFIEQRDLVTVPPLAQDIWRIEMMTPERQKVSPFFLGGEVILVSYPTDTMDQDDKMMSMRGNNVHFSRSTVFHELIPGHHLQGFMTERYSPHRRAFATPFWTEGWSLYWEFLLWDLGFPRSPEDRVGMLFWRMHRCARIIFSLSFHLGKMTPQECIDLLVNRVGHERANAEAEVRRSFNGTYSPLYQVAYMIGGLQFRALHAEFVDSGKITNREFHDTILRNGRIPVEMVRAILANQPPAPEYRATWKFAGEF